MFADKEQRLSVMSIGFLLDSPDVPVVWRGPKKNGTLCSFPLRLAAAAAATVSQCSYLVWCSCHQAVPGGRVLGRSRLSGNRHAARYAPTLICPAHPRYTYIHVHLLAGTSDEHISVTQYLGSFNPDGAVIVTTPQVRPELMARCSSANSHFLTHSLRQGVSLSDVRKEISFCKKIGLPVLGVVENMSGFVCPCCQVLLSHLSS